MPAKPLRVSTPKELYDKLEEVKQLTVKEKRQVNELVNFLQSERKGVNEFLDHIKDEEFASDVKVKKTIEGMKKHQGTAMERCLVIKRIIYQEEGYENSLIDVRLATFKTWKAKKIKRLEQREIHLLLEFNTEADEVKKLNSILRKAITQARLPNTVYTAYFNATTKINHYMDMIRFLTAKMIEEAKKQYEDIKIMLEQAHNRKGEMEIRKHAPDLYGLR